MKVEYNKLVRNKVPNIIKAEGAKVKVKKLKEDSELVEALHQKLIEESNEVTRTKNNPELLADELGDVLEVVEALAKAGGITMKEVKAAKKTKKAEKGNFSGRKLLVHVEK